MFKLALMGAILACSFSSLASPYPPDKTIIEQCHSAVVKLSAYPDYTQIKRTTPVKLIKFSDSSSWKEVYFRLIVKSPWNVPMDDVIRCRFTPEGNVVMG